MLRKLLASSLALTVAAGLAFAAEPSTQPVKSYPLKTCIVSGEDLGDMGEPHVEVYKGQEVKFCCKACVAKFEKDPEKYLKKIEAKKGPTTNPA
ncbi:MAG: YHS domain-containing protein [Tepidisphaeraceae bacterium]